MGRMSDLAGKLDDAVERADAQRQAVKTAQAALERAQQDLNATVEEIRKLHGEQQSIMRDILSFGGTQHVATHG